MCGAIPPFPQYAFMVWCSVESTGTTLPFMSSWCGTWLSMGTHSNLVLYNYEVQYVLMDK